MTEKRPNFLIILADDLGYSDIGCFGSEIETPNLDKLASEGLRLTDYHTAAVCSPTRSMLLSGTDCHLAGVGVMSEFRTVDPERWNKPGHEGFMNHDVAAISEILVENGYHTYLSGKWHLGWQRPYLPSSRGFERSFTLLPGSSNHYAWQPNLDTSVHDPKKKFLPGHSLALYAEDGIRLNMEANSTNEPDKGFYSSRTYAERLIDYIDDGHKDGKPFFAYLPFTAPHYPLQCSKRDREKYRGKYNDGPEALRQSRLAGMKKLGIIREETVAHPVMANTETWENLTDEERALSARAMEAYAGMVDAMDQEIGRVVDHLKKIGEYDNTFIIFQSDNGAEGDAYESNPAMGPDLMATLHKYYDNSLENIGNHNSFVWYGPRWAQASTAPSRLMKAYSTEGGIRVPCVIRYPSWTKKHDAGSLLRPFSTVMDIVPTILDMAGITHPNANPKDPRAKASFNGHQVYPVRGKSWVPFLERDIRASGDDVAAESGAIHGEKDSPVGWEMFGRAALRKGMWKINHMNANDWGKGQWELFNLEKDPGEVDDLAEKMPKKLAELVKDFDVYVKETGTIWGGRVDMKASRTPLPEDMIGGDPIADQRAWMGIKAGSTLS